MNIFDVLNRGKSRLHEPSMSAMLAYLIDSTEDHGLGDSFLKIFLKNINNKITENIFTEEILSNPIIVDVSLEEPYLLNGNRKDIDIQLIILNRNKNEIFRLIIENKIKTSSASPEQLNDYYNAVLEDEKDIENMLFLFITPKSDNNRLEEEYENLKINRKHRKCWLYWTDDELSIQNMMVDILKRESIGEINPLNEYIKHTIKAFVKYLNRISIISDEKKKSRFGEDIGDIIEEKIIKLSDGEYTIIKRNSKQIQVYKEDEKIVAKPILRKIITEKNLNIKEEETYTLTTRQLGQKILALKIDD